MKYRIKTVEVPRHSVVKVTFDDGLSGEIEIKDMVGMFAPLQDESFFRKVSVEPHGRSFGWNLDEIGREIDFCADATRIEIEAAKVAKMADDYSSQRPAAE